MSTAVDVATLCDITVRRVQQLAKEGVMPKLAPGSYDLLPCANAYFKYLHAAMSAKSTMDGAGKISNTSQQRGKMLDVGVALEELKLAKARGEVMAVVDHEAILSDLILATKASVMAVGPRVAGKIVDGMSRSDRQAMVDAGNREALMQLAALVPAARAPKKAKAKKVPLVLAIATSEPLQAARTELGALLAALLRDRQSAAPIAIPTPSVTA